MMYSNIGLSFCEPVPLKSFLMIMLMLQRPEGETAVADCCSAFETFLMIHFGVAETRKRDSSRRLLFCLDCQGPESLI